MSRGSHGGSRRPGHHVHHGPAGYTNANNVGLGGGGRQFFIAEGERSSLIMATGRVFELNTIFDL